MKGLPVGWTLFYIRDTIKSYADVRWEVHAHTCACRRAGAKECTINNIDAREQIHGRKKNIDICTVGKCEVVDCQIY